MDHALIDTRRLEANAQLDPKNKGALGQFMTPSAIARFMASLFEDTQGAYLLDAGAGIGSLSHAASSTLNLAQVDAWEIDPIMRGYLHQTLDDLHIPYTVHPKDFILDSVERISNHVAPAFTHAILNPPYKKINSNSIHRKACSQIGIETVNLYTAFLALSILQMRPLGQIVVIIPRSFCNGPYYKPFRELMLQECSIDRIHVFESRNQAFKDDEVLQENIILKLTRGKLQADVQLSFSKDATLADLHKHTVPFAQVVHPNDRELFIRVPMQDQAQAEHSVFAHTLKELGLEVCTGPVVDFRLKPWWSQEPTADSVPCIYPHHISSSGVEYPKAHKKPNALLRSPEVDKWLMPQGTYVLVRRFSAKEERRRVVAYLITPQDVDSSLIGFENHWNVFHIKKAGLPLDIAKGLMVFLNSTAVDDYFRVFSGHTQVNATDLRNMKYPSLELLHQMGMPFARPMSQEQIDQQFQKFV